ncbi:MAG TPA: hypothetical protein GYA10_06425 [Alphaproteobacteria bacterium]|nr:hypothetical protein [Alphaproteobacteria bacterium]
MKLQALISSAVLAGALAFPGAAMAQAVIGGTEIPAEQMQRFHDACEALQAESTASLTADDTDETDPGTVADPTTTGSVASDDTSDSSDPAAQDNWDEVIAGLTLEDCEAGGFLVTP